MMIVYLFRILILLYGSILLGNTHRIYAYIYISMRFTILTTDSFNQSYMISRSTSSKYDRTFSSDIVNATQNPVWNTNHIFLGVDSEEWASLKLEISVWNYSNHLDHKCLGTKIYTYIDKLIEIAIYSAK